MTSTDTQEALDEAMFALSARLKLSGFLDDGANHAAYERVVAVWTNRRTPPTPATDEREAVARAVRAERSGVLIALWAEYRAQSSEKLPVTIDDAHSRHRYLVSAFADAALSALAPIRAAEILAAEARGYAKAIEDAANEARQLWEYGIPSQEFPRRIRAIEHGAGK